VTIPVPLIVDALNVLSGHHALCVSGGSPRALRAATAARDSSVASLRASSGVRSMDPTALTIVNVTGPP
jgi:hypothetical protein